MNVVGFNASPHARGNTAWAVNTLLQGAREEGARTVSWQSGELDLRPCQGCFACHKGDRRCILPDDMARLHDELAGAGAVVLGTPVYMGQMSAQAKIFTDRLHALFMPRFSPYFREAMAGKRLVLAFTQGNPDADVFRDYFEYTRKIFGMLEFDVRDVAVVAGTRNGPAREQEGVEAGLLAMGAALAR